MLFFVEFNFFKAYLVMYTRIYIRYSFGGKPTRLYISENNYQLSSPLRYLTWLRPQRLLLLLQSAGEHIYPEFTPEGSSQFFPTELVISGLPHTLTPTFALPAFPLLNLPLK